NPNPPGRPVAPALSPASGVVHDETSGIQNFADPNSADDVAGAGVPAGILGKFNGLGAALGFAASAGGLAIPSGGSVPVTVEYTLNVTDGTFSGVSTTEGTQVFLFQGTGASEGLILGRAGNEAGAIDTANPNGAVAFALAIDPASGQGYVAQ